MLFYHTRVLVPTDYFVLVLFSFNVSIFYYNSNSLDIFSLFRFDKGVIIVIYQTSIIYVFAYFIVIAFSLL